MTRNKKYKDPVTEMLKNIGLVLAAITTVITVFILLTLLNSMDDDTLEANIVPISAMHGIVNTGTAPPPREGNALSVNLVAEKNSIEKALAETPEELLYEYIYRNNDRVLDQEVTMTGVVHSRVHGPKGNTDYYKVNVSTDPCDRHSDWIYLVYDRSDMGYRLVPGDLIELTGTVGRISRVAITWEYFEHMPRLDVTDMTVIEGAGSRNYTYCMNTTTADTSMEVIDSKR